MQPESYLGRTYLRDEFKLLNLTDETSWAETATVIGERTPLSIQPAR
jgi:hypothetical protein